MSATVCFFLATALQCNTADGLFNVSVFTQDRYTDRHFYLLGCTLISVLAFDFGSPSGIKRERGAD